MILVYKDGIKPFAPPFRITLSDGTRRTDPTSFTEEELIDAGYKIAPPKPFIVPLGMITDWDIENERWISVGKYEKPIEANHWYFINKEVLDLLLEESNFVKMRLIESGSVTTEIEAHIDALNNVDLFQSPTSVVWPQYNPSV